MEVFNVLNSYTSLSESPPPTPPNRENRSLDNHGMTERRRKISNGSTNSSSSSTMSQEIIMNELGRNHFSSRSHSDDESSSTCSTADSSNNSLISRPPSKILAAFGSAWRRVLLNRRNHAYITRDDPTGKVTYLGNVVTTWGKGDGSLDRPAAALWRNHTQGRGAIRMVITVTAQGLKAQTREHGLTEYWANRLTWCGTVNEYPDMFCWIYRHEGRKLKQELRCHAVLCAKESRARLFATTLKNRLCEALYDFRREKIIRQNARLSLLNCVNSRDISNGYHHSLNGSQQSLVGNRVKALNQNNSFDENDLRLTNGNKNKNLSVNNKHHRKQSMMLRTNMNTSVVIDAQTLSTQPNCPSQNYKQPLEKSKSAPKLSSIQEEDDFDFEVDFEDFDGLDYDAEVNEDDLEAGEELEAVGEISRDPMDGQDPDVEDDVNMIIPACVPMPTYSSHNLSNLPSLSGYDKVVHLLHIKDCSATSNNSNQHPNAKPNGGNLVDENTSDLAPSDPVAGATASSIITSTDNKSHNNHNKERDDDESESGYSDGTTTTNNNTSTKNSKNISNVQNTTKCDDNHDEFRNIQIDNKIVVVCDV